MQLEVDIALNFLLSFLYNKLPRRRVNQFGEELEKAIKIKFQDHWYTEQPSKGSAYRCLKTTTPIDPILEWASLEAGIQLTDIKDNLPDELSIWIDPGEVSYRLSERSPIKILYSVRQNTQQQQQQQQQTIICHNTNCNQQAPLDLLEPMELLESFASKINKLDKKDDKTGATIGQSDADFKLHNFESTNSQHNILSQQNDGFILDLNQEAKQNQIYLKSQQLQPSAKNANVHDEYLAFLANNFKTNANVNHVPTQTSDFVLSSSTEQVHQTPDTDIYGKQFKIPQTSGPSWSSGSSSSVSSVGSTIGTIPGSARSKSANNNQLGQICPDRSENFNNMAIINHNKNENNDYHLIQQQRFNSNQLDSNYCSDQSQPSMDQLHHQNSIRFPTTINDYSLLSGNVNQNINHQNLMMYLRSPTKHSIEAPNPFNGQTKLASPISCQQNQQSRINSRNNSFSSSNSLGGSSSSGSIMSAGSSTSSKSSRCQSSFLSGFCGQNGQQTIPNSHVDSPSISTKAQPLVFTAAMFAQTKFGSTKLKNQNNGHNHHTMVNHGAPNLAAPFGNNQQQNVLRLSSLSNQNQQNSMLAPNHILAGSTPAFASTAMRSPNHHLHNQQQPSSHPNQQMLSQFIPQGSNNCIINNNRYTMGTCASSSATRTRQQHSQFFARSNDLKTSHLASPNLLAIAYDTPKTNHLDYDEINGSNQAKLFATNELININQGHHGDNSKVNLFEKPLNGLVNFDHQQNKKSTTIEPALQDNTFDSFMRETSMMDFVDRFSEDDDLMSGNGNLKVKEETMRQLESIFNLHETNCELLSHRDDDITSKQGDLLRSEVYKSDSINTPQDIRQLTSDPSDLTTNEYRSSDKPLDFDYSSYELWSTRTNPLAKHDIFVESVVQDNLVRANQIQDDDDKKSNEESLVDERNCSKFSNLFLEEQAQNSSMEEPSLDEDIHYPTLYQACKKHDQDNNQDEIRDILMRIMTQQPVKTIASEASPSSTNTDVAGGVINATGMLGPNKDMIDQNYPLDKSDGPVQSNIADIQVENESYEMNDKVLEGDSNCWYKSPVATKDTLSESNNEMPAESNENNDCSNQNVVVSEKNNDKSEEFPKIELNEENNSLSRKERHLAVGNDPDTGFDCANESTNNSSLMQPLDSENESLVNNDDKTQLIISSTVVDPGIVSVNSSVTSANYSATSNQCKQQTQQQTQQLLLAN